MGLKEIEKIKIFKILDKYRRVKPMGFIRIAACIIFLFIIGSLVFMIIYKIPDGVDTVGTIEHQNKYIIYSNINAEILKILVSNYSRVLNDQVIILFKTDKNYLLEYDSRKNNSFQTSIEYLKTDSNNNEYFLPETGVISPIKGIIDFNKDIIFLGNELKYGDKICDITPDEKVIVKLRIPERIISKIKLNQKVFIYPETFPKHKHKGIEGILYYMSSNVVDGFIIGKVKLNNDFIQIKHEGEITQDKLLSGMRVNARIITDYKSVYKYVLGINDN